MPEREARAALARHPSTRPLARCPFAIVPGGLSNHAWRVEHAGAGYFVRLGDFAADRLGVDRASECALLASVAAAGFAPPLVLCDPSSRLLVTRFVSGRHWSREDTRSPGNLRRIGETLRRLHALPLASGVRRLDFAAQASNLQTELARLEPVDAGVRSVAQEAIEALTGRETEVTLCHNDLHHLNVLDDGDRLWLVDWEYGGCGNPAFDLAGLFCLHDATRVQRETVLDAYGRRDLESSPQLEAACRLFDCVQWLWYRLWLATHPGANGTYAARATALRLRLGAAYSK